MVRPQQLSYQWPDFFILPIGLVEVPRPKQVGPRESTESGLRPRSSLAHRLAGIEKIPHRICCEERRMVRPTTREAPRLPRGHAQTPPSRQRWRPDDWCTECASRLLVSRLESRCRASGSHLLPRHWRRPQEPAPPPRRPPPVTMDRRSHLELPELPGGQDRTPSLDRER